MEQKEAIEKILTHVQDIKVSQGKIEVHIGQHRKEIDTLSVEHDKMKSSQNKAIGFLTFGGLFGTAFFAWLFKHFSE